MALSVLRCVRYSGSFCGAVVPSCPVSLACASQTALCARDRGRSRSSGSSSSSGASGSGASGRPPAAAFCSQSPNFYDTTIAHFARQPLTPVTLQKMIEFGRMPQSNEAAASLQKRLFISAQFLHSELPRRLARRLTDIQTLPYLIVTNPHIKRVYELYFRAFETFRTFPPVETTEQEAAFTQLLQAQLVEHASTVQLLARGLQEANLKLMSGKDFELDDFLHQMLRSRISRRVLAQQHVALHHPQEGYIGIIGMDLRPTDVINACVDQARDICERTYGEAPEFNVTGAVDAVFSYIPVHLEYMMFELLKNSARAVVEWHRFRSESGRKRKRAGTTPLPPVDVTIFKGTTDLFIRISDQGGGIPKEHLDKIWKYGFTTRLSEEEISDDRPFSVGDAVIEAGDVFHGGEQMAGLGFGLPLSKLYAEYFGGSLQLVSMPSFGTTVFVRLGHLGTNPESF